LVVEISRPRFAEKSTVYHHSSLRTKAIPSN
jgi:hypothetical protein